MGQEQDREKLTEIMDENSVVMLEGPDFAI